MRFDLTNLPNNIDTLRGMIVTQAANFAAELGAREAELAAAKAGLLAKTLEIEKLKLHIARLRRAQFGRYLRSRCRPDRRHSRTRSALYGSPVAMPPAPGC